MGVHTGEAHERGGDYFGSALNRTARIMSAGHGGQVLVSDVTAGLLTAEDFSLREVGPLQLRGLSRPEVVSQVFADGLATEFPRLRSHYCLFDHRTRSCSATDDRWDRSLRRSTSGDHGAGAAVGGRSFVVSIAVALIVAACGGGEPDDHASPSSAVSVGAETSDVASAEPSPIETTTSATASTTATTPVAAVAKPLEVVTEWITSFESGDVLTFQGLMHPDATAECVACGYDRQETGYFDQIGEGTGDVSDSRLLALGNGSMNAVCAADGVVVKCETLRSSDFGHFTIEGEPTRQLDATYEFAVEDGLITRRVITWNEGAAFDFARLADYKTWLRENHPEVHAEIYAFGTILLTTVEQFASHQEYVPQYWATR